MLVDNQSSHTTIRHTNNLFQKTYYKKYDFLTNSIEAARKIFFAFLMAEMSSMTKFTLNNLYNIT